MPALAPEISIHAPHTGRDAQGQRRGPRPPPFQSTRPIRGATSKNNLSPETRYISIHAPHTGRDFAAGMTPQRAKISIHAPHTGRDLIFYGFHLVICGAFQSTRPIRGATIASPMSSSGRAYFNPRAPYGARRQRGMQYFSYLGISIHAPHTGRDIKRPNGSGTVYISIHAPHTGRDVNVALIVVCSQAISIHAPHTGRDPTWATASAALVTFQSTRPIRGATVSQMAGGSDNQISIHAPHTGRDGGGYSCDSVPCVFQSTRPIRGATTSKGSAVGKAIYFNPRAPYGARPGVEWMQSIKILFQSTRPIRGATGSTISIINSRLNFNPRAPYGARHCAKTRCCPSWPYFNPRAPYGARHVNTTAQVATHSQFQSTRPIRGATVLVR